jgi:mRNA interferase HigB
MEITGRKKLLDFWEKHPNAQNPLSRWFKLAEEAEWEKFSDVRAAFRSADMVDKFIVFNIGGNKYRLIIDIDYIEQEIQIRHVLTHAEYDRGRWKIRPAT